jgi:hypothetical protein
MEGQTLHKKRRLASLVLSDFVWLVDTAFTTESVSCFWNVNLNIILAQLYN